MLGLSGTLSCALFVYLCICVFVFVYLCMRHLVISVLISLDQVLSENIWFVWSKLGLAMWKFLAMRYHSASMREYALFHITLVKKITILGPFFGLFLIDF